jgi:hypothetical protein
MTEEAKTLSCALFAAINTLVGAEAQLQEAITIHADCSCSSSDPQRIVASLFHAMRVAHAACETALTRVEPMYDADFREDTACVETAETALANANTVAWALDYASTQYTIWLSLPSPPSQEQLCGEKAMCAAIDSKCAGAVALGVVMLSECHSVVPPRGSQSLFIHAMTREFEFPLHMLHVLLSSHVLYATITDADCNDTTLLMYAAQHDQHESIIALLACPEVVASVGVVDANGNNALMLAARHGKTETVKALLACPAIYESASAGNIHEYTALMLAVNRGNTEIIKALLACPTVVASAGICSKYGYTALMFAASVGNSPAVTMLLACPAVVESAGAATVTGFTALMLASMRGCEEVVSALLTCPAAVASAAKTNWDGDTARSIAVKFGFASIVDALDNTID